MTIIGLYTNVPEGGMFDEYQIAWLESELAQAPADKALLLAMHDPVYSADGYHNGSPYLATTLDRAIERSGHVPDAFLAGHVHNYQRFTRTWKGREIPFDNFQVESLHHKGVYVHTKLIVIDPFSAHPIVVTGSANFSRNSSLNNDENQLIIIDQPAVADVYLGEFMRMYDHYTFRFFLAHAQAGQVENFLRTDDSWTDKCFNNALERRDSLIFSGREAS